MNVKQIFQISSVFSLLAISGCSTLYGEEGVFRGKTKDYLRAGKIDPIVVPEDMASTTANLSPLFVVPDVNADDDFGDPLSLDEYDVPRPAGANTEKGEVGVKLQKLGESKWIFLSASTSQVWPRTQNFLNKFGIPVINSNPALGLIETGDVNLKDYPDTTSRFKIYIQKGIHPETTEVHLLQTEFPRDQQNPDVKWGDVSVDVEKERLILDELAGVLAESVNNNSASLLGQNVGGEDKITFTLIDQEPAMQLKLNAVRARATVAHALQKEGFKTWGETGDSNVVYVGFDWEYKEDRSWFGKLFHSEVPDKPKYPIDQVLQHLSDSPKSKQLFAQVDQAKFGSALPKAKGYLVVLTTSGADVNTVIRDVRGELIPHNDAKKLLRIIRKNLI